MENRKRAYRRACERKQKKRMKELYDIFWAYGSGIYEQEGGYLVRKGKGHRYNWLKTYSNRKIRRNKDLKLKRNEYRKTFDLWWEYF